MSYVPDLKLKDRSASVSLTKWLLPSRLLPVGRLPHIF